jgi:hypothetical protein
MGTKKLLTLVVPPIIVGIAFCVGEWRAENIAESIAKENQAKQMLLPKPTEVDPEIIETVKTFKESPHDVLMDCIIQARQISSLLGDLVVEHKSFGTCRNWHDDKYASVDFDKSMDEIVKFKKYLMDRCPNDR